MDVDAKDEQGRTPLSLASRKGHAGVVGVLLAAPGIDDVNRMDKWGCTPLWVASEYGNTEVVELLLRAPGIDVRQGDRNGHMPLSNASREGRAEVVELPLAAPGTNDVSWSDEDGVMSLAITRELGHAPVVAVLSRQPLSSTACDGRPWPNSAGACRGGLPATLAIRGLGDAHLQRLAERTRAGSSIQSIDY